MAPDLELRGVSVSFGERIIFSGVNLRLSAGQCTVILGPSGVGKTTLLRTIVGDAPYMGEITIGGRLVKEGTTPSEVGIVTQSAFLWDHLTVQENISLVRRLCLGEPREVAEAKSLRHLALLEVDHLGTRYPHSLSGGEQQRTGLARGMAAERPIMLLDEVTSNVDVARREIIRRAIATMLEHGRSVLFATHDLLTVRDMPYPARELGANGLREVTAG